DDERQRQGRTRVVCGGRAGENDDAGPDDAADAEQSQVGGIQCAPQLIARFLLMQLGDRPGRKKLARHGTPGFSRRTLHKRPVESEASLLPRLATGKPGLLRGEADARSRAHATRREYVARATP